MLATRPAQWLSLVVFAALMFEAIFMMISRALGLRLPGSLRRGRRGPLRVLQVRLGTWCTPVFAFDGVIIANAIIKVKRKRDNCDKILPSPQKRSDARTKSRRAAHVQIDGAGERLAVPKGKPAKRAGRVGRQEGVEWPQAWVIEGRAPIDGSQKRPNVCPM